VVLAPKLRALLAVEGGFTVNAVTGRHARGGIAVCVHPEASAPLGPREWTDHRLSRWLRDTAPHLVRPGRYAGGWLEPATGQVCLDVVTVMPGAALRAALGAGRLAGQRSVFDLDRRRVVVIPRRAP
jgi:hypothetical protein